MREEYGFVPSMKDVALPGCQGDKENEQGFPTQGTAMSLPLALWYTEQAIRGLVRRHIAMYPLVELQEVFKLLYQAV